MFDFKTMIKSAYNAGYDTSSIMNEIQKNIKELEAEQKAAKVKEFEEKNKAAHPWVYGIAAMDKYADKIKNHSLTKQEAIELFIAAAIKDLPAHAVDILSDDALVATFSKNTYNFLKHLVHMTAIVNDDNISADRKLAKMFELIQDFAVDCEKDATELKKTPNLDDSIFLEFIKNL